MSTVWMILIIVGYVAVWLTTAVAAARWIADMGYCHDRIRSWTRSHCLRYDVPNCWRADGEVTIANVLVATLIALAWPLLAPPALVYWAATRKPTPVGLRQRIDELERELGIGDEH